MPAVSDQLPDAVPLFCAKVLEVHAGHLRMEPLDPTVLVELLVELVKLLIELFIELLIEQFFIEFVK